MWGRNRYIQQPYLRLVSNFGMEWETAEIETHTLYKAFSPKEIKAHIGMKIGLRGVNITMKGWLQRFILRPKVP